MKCVRRDARKAVYRGRVRSTTRTLVKKARTLVDRGQIAKPETMDAIREACIALDKAAEKGVIHRNNAARRKARLVRAAGKAMLDA